MISHPVDITLTAPMLEAVLNAEEAGGLVPRSTSVVVLKGLARRGLADAGSHPAYLTDDGRTIAEKAAHTTSKTFTLLRPNGGR